MRQNDKCQFLELICFVIGYNCELKICSNTRINLNLLSCFNWGGIMVKRKVVTLCGSVRFWNEIQEMSERLELENEYVVIGIIPHIMDRDLTEYEKDLLGELHRIKIDLSDAIFVVNIDGYIGESVKKEIEYAKENEKEIIYLENN